MLCTYWSLRSSKKKLLAVLLVSSPILLTILLHKPNSAAPPLVWNISIGDEAVASHLIVLRNNLTDRLESVITEFSAERAQPGLR